MTEKAKFKYSAQEGILELEGSEDFVSKHFESLTDLIRIISRHVVVEQKQETQPIPSQPKNAEIVTVNSKTWGTLYPMLTKGEFDKVKAVVSKDKSTIARMLGMGLARQGAIRRREDIEIAMEESMMEIIPQLEKRTPYVALLSNIATLLGLLGTIMGLIQAFTAVANANPAEKADLLSASISVAMNTTAFGLMSAIPLLLLHAKLTSTTGHIVDSLEMASVKALNSISNFARRQIEAS